MSLRRSCFSVVLVCSLVTALCVPAISQSKRGKRKTTPQQVRTELVVTPPEPPRKIGQANVSYAADSNETQVDVSLMVPSQPEGSSELFVGFLITGKELTR